MNLLKHLVALKFKGVPRNKIKVPQYKGKTWLYPWSLERGYAVSIAKMLKPLQAQVLATLEAAYPAMSKTFRKDDAADDLDMVNKSLYEWQQQTIGQRKGAFWSQVFSLGGELSTFNQGQWSKFVEGLLGYAFNGDEPWLSDAINLWADQNHKLIKSISDTYIGRVNQMVTDAVQGGVRWEELRPAIMNLEKGLTNNRAKLIARDQVGKLNGQLTKHRMEDAGIDEYKWLTSNDERVRSTHAPLMGKICRWDNPNVWKVDGNWVDRPMSVARAHPGYEIQCRCTAIPVLDSFFASLEV